jgi:hypothetical protein
MIDTKELNETLKYITGKEAAIDDATEQAARYKEELEVYKQTPIQILYPNEDISIITGCLVAPGLLVISLIVAGIMQRIEPVAIGALLMIMMVAVGAVYSRNIRAGSARLNEYNTHVDALATKIRNGEQSVELMQQELDEYCAYRRGKLHDRHERTKRSN